MKGHFLLKCLGVAQFSGHKDRAFEWWRAQKSANALLRSQSPDIR